MKNKQAIATVFSFAICLAAFGSSPLDLLMPQPVWIMRGEGTVSGAPLEKVESAKAAVPQAPSAVADEAYVLDIRADGVKITAPGERGERYARVTLAQLRKLSGGEVPVCTITDWPAFRWRGYMNDCGRNYLDVSGVKAILDVMGAYKMNLFHWHLADYHGWRLESKKYPQLNRPESQLRQVGRFYTQDEFREIVRYAAERGITVMPELDVPGHTLAFRRGMGIDSMKAPGTDKVISELFEELCSLASADEMPFVHIGTDEVRVKAEYCDETWPTKWVKTINAAGRKAVVWAPGKMIDPSCDTIDMVWYDNHVTNTTNEAFDSARMYNASWTPFEVPLHAAFTQPCRWKVAADRKLGAITCTWHDDNVGDDNLKLFKECMVFPSIVAMSDTYWHGRDRDDPELIFRAPMPGSEAFERFQLFEQRMVAQRDRALAGFPHPFVVLRQTQMRWRVTDCATGKVLVNGAAQGSLRLDTFWRSDPEVSKGDKGRVAVETWIKAPKDIECGAWIDLAGLNGVYGRLGVPNTPKAGEWNTFGGKVELNGEVLPPPAWKQPGMTSTTKAICEQDVPYSTDLLEKPLVDEMPALRAPYPVKLKKGWNHLVISTGVRKLGGWTRNLPVSFALIEGSSTNPREVPDLEYSANPPE